MKVMISQPMNGVNPSKIFEERKELIKKFNKMHIEVVDTYFRDEPEDTEGYNQPALYYLAESIDILGKVDAIYFVENWRSARGCRVERKVAEEYGIKILDYTFFEDQVENTRKMKGVK